MNKNIYIIILSIVLGFILGWFLNQESRRNSIINKHVSILDEQFDNQDTENHLNEKYKYCDDVISYNPLTVKYTENAICNCDSAYTNLEINYCSGVKACLEEKRFDSLNNRLIQIYDSLNVEQNNEINNWIEQGDSSMLDHVTDYKKIKNLHIESTKNYLRYADLEKTIIGIEVGTGRLRTYYENSRWIEILEIKNQEYEKLINEYIE